MKKNLKLLISGMLLLGAVKQGVAQSIPTIEMPFVTTVTNSGTGASTNPVAAQFRNDALNNNTFSTYNGGASNLTVSFANQQFTGFNYGTSNYQGSGFSTVQSTGLVFGIAPTLASDPLPVGGFPYDRYNKIGVYGGGGGPTNSMFTSNPTATGAQLGTGINVITGSPSTINGGVEVFTTAQVLFSDTIAHPRGSRVYFGDVVLTFSEPVKNPVIHVAGLGGFYSYLRSGGNAGNPADYFSTYFTTELELATPGLTSTLMSSNPLMVLSGNNILNANHANPNGGSVVDPSEAPFNNYGAATGSVRINGTVQTLTYRVYLQGGSSSQFAWSATAAQVPGALRDPFTGDIWYIAASFDKPTLQVITGNVFNDADGLIDNNVSQTLTSVGPVANPKTNAGGLIYANLISGGVVVATMPVPTNGTFLFDNVAPGTYTVQISSNQGVVGQPQPATALPSGWINTGEFNGAGAGNDALTNGISAPIVVVAGDTKTDINFGIERLPESVDFQRTLPTTPALGETILLNTPGSVKFGDLPILSGSDPEDQPATGVLTGKSVKFTSLAVVGLNSVPCTLRYNGAVITLNQVIPNFNASLLTVTLPNIQWTGGGGNGIRFNYAYVDAAGQVDPTPALYKLVWSFNSLPITLSGFEVNKNNCTANLAWKTASETNSDRFEIEVSTSVNPTYSKVSTVLAAGSASTTTSYQFSYPMQAGTVYYFRLKMIEKTGAFTYSDIKSASCSKGAGGIVLGPNPTTDYFTIRGMQDGKNKVQVYAANGQLVHEQDIQANQGKVEIDRLAPGMYTVKVTNLISETTVAIKLIKY